MTRLGVSYFLERSLRRVEEDLGELRDSGFEVVVHTFTEHDARYNFRRMEEIAELTSGLGLEGWADPWGVAGIFGGESFSRFLSLHPEAVARDRDGNPVYSACLTSDETLLFVFDHVKKIKEAGFSSLFLDELHVKGGGCWCDRCRRKFLENVGKPMERAAEGELKKFFKRVALTFTRSLVSFARELGMEVHLCLFPRNSRLATVSLGDVEDMERELATVGYDPYPVHHRAGLELAESHLRELQKWPGKTHYWLQLFKLRKEEVEMVLEEGEMALGRVDVLLFWGFRCCEFLSSLSCEDPYNSWDRVKGRVRKWCGRS